MTLHLAQLNVATLVAPLDHASIEDFREGLAPVNAAGEAAAGYVWRLQTEDGDATSIKAFADPLTIVNLTVWESLDALRVFAYRGIHRDFLRRRREWFVPDRSRTALWWIRAGELPTVDDAVSRLAFIDAFGDSAYAFQMHDAMTGAGSTPLVLERTTLDRGAALVAALNDELAAMYPEPGSNFFSLDDEQVAPGHGAFVVARLGADAVACGAYRKLDDTTAEVKRMYVVPSSRGTKIGAAMAWHLRDLARRDGVTRLVLETGARQSAALGLYSKLGFRPCRCWGEYGSAPLSRCFALDL